MRRWERICGSTALAVALLAGVPAGQARAVAARAVKLRCEPNYDYAGVQEARATSGIRAVVTTISPSVVRTGHVGAWLGVGGPGLGPSGSDEWLQVGYASFASGQTQIYYEVTKPGRPTVYHTVKDRIPLGESHLLTVLEVRGRPGSWRAWVDATPVTPVIALAESHGRFAPLALGETWNAGSDECNGYGYRFTRLRTAKDLGGSWGRSAPGHVWHDRQNQFLRLSPDSFVARTTSPPEPSRR
jgi:hypothetical protein